MLLKLIDKILFYIQGETKPTLTLEKLFHEYLSAEQIDNLLSLLIRAKDNSRDENLRYQIAEVLTMAVYPKYKFSEYGRLFLEDQEFLEYYEKFMDPQNWHSLDRKYVLRELLKLVSSLDGDIVECGSYQGASAWLMCKMVNHSERTVHLFDSFEGLSTPGEKDGDYWVEGALQSSENKLRDNLHGYQNYQVYKGWKPTQFMQCQVNKISFLHLDVDLFEPTLESLKHFYSCLQSRGIILMDDYGFKSCPGAKLAADEFFANKPEPIISLPTGQALVMKQ